MSTSRPAAKKVSLADIARRAGVSTNTVSRVVRGDPEVSEKTRARIAKLVEELGYVPNYAARALAAKRTNVLQVVLAAPMFHGHGRVLLSILNASAQAGYHVSMSYAYGPDGQLRNDFAPFDVDGVIILGGQDPTIDVAIESGKRFPTVLVLTSEKGLDGISTVAVDNVRGGVVPRDVRVVGFDDIDGADSYAPPLTTIHQPFDRLGRTAVRLVRSLMGGGPSQDIVLDPELVIRASSHL